MLTSRFTYATYWEYTVVNRHNYLNIPVLCDHPDGGVHSLERDGVGNTGTQAMFAEGAERSCEGDDGVGYTGTQAMFTVSHR